MAVITIGPHIDTTNTCILEECAMQLGIDVVIGRTKNEESPVIEDGIIMMFQALIEGYGRFKSNIKISSNE